MKKLSILLFAAFILSACTQEQLPVANYDIISLPKVVQLYDEQYFTLQEKTKVYYETSLQREAQFLSEYVDDIMGFAMEVQEYQGQSDGIVLKLVPADFDQAEAYEINVTPKQVTIKGADAAGVFYGIQTLRKSVPLSPSQRGAGGSKTALPCGTIHDFPTFAYRGMHLDPCRHFMEWTWTR